MPDVVVGSVTVALHRVVIAPTGLSNVVRVEMMRPRDAAALVVLVDMAKKRGWRIARKEHVRKMAKAADLLAVLRNALLPVPDLSGRHVPDLTLVSVLTDYAAVLWKDSRAVAGSFRRRAQDFHNLLIHFADAVPVESPPQLADRLDRLMDEVERLLDTPETLTH